MPSPENLQRAPQWETYIITQTVRATLGLIPEHAGFYSNGGIHEFLSNFYFWSFTLAWDAATHPDSLLAEHLGAR
ncbi:hypothetical protein [Paenarthrobacter sp. 4246]|uniref:hypothetical protein n=1 Tax=Paenarthrobacter sp. 4246 TaxID=3156456 RepID=UPI0033930FCC